MALSQLYTPSWPSCVTYTSVVCAGPSGLGQKNKNWRLFLDISHRDVRTVGCMTKRFSEADPQAGRYIEIWGLNLTSVIMYDWAVPFPSQIKGCAKHSGMPYGSREATRSYSTRQAWLALG